jgi:mono/diheme cytochrome c family protein
MRTVTIGIGAGCLLVASATLLAARPAGADPVPAEAAEFFEAKVRPVLAESCVRCHGPKKQSSGLRLDSRAAVLEGGENGPAIVPGDPDKSLLIQAVRYAHEDYKMPPKAKLPDPAVEALAEWVRRGAPWPVEKATSAADPASAAHWAFRPVAPVSPPAVTGSAWVASPIDAFVLAKLEAQGMESSGPADRRTLIRRASFDLTGLPPTAEEVEAFLADEAPDAFARVVDRLLASPRYGERWGRHWLDVARYADTKGYVFQEDRRYPYAYTYRDYVIRSFNEDKPYDRFILEQVAADRLPTADDPRTLAALGFLTVGRRFLNNQDDILDDRIDVVTRGLLGLTVACARCHDHKYDPIPTDDYYSLHGVFASSPEPAELPLIPGDTPSPEAADYERQRRELQAKADEFLAAKHAEVIADFRDRAGTYLLAAFDLGFNPQNPKLDERARADKLGPARLRRAIGLWKSYLESPAGKADPVFSAWHALAALPAPDFAAKAASLRDGRPTACPPVAEALAATPVGSMRDVVARYAALLDDAGVAGVVREVVAMGVLRTPAVVPARAVDPGRAAVRASVASATGPGAFALGETQAVLDRAERNKLRALAKKVSELASSHPGAPPRAMVVNDAAQPVNPYVFVRGNRGRRGKEVPRQFLAILSGPDRKPFAQGSGRLDLARAIASPDNPLTARVLVNRVWMHHFGSGLVATPSDFGLRSEPPSHPELLDWLAGALVRDGWSIKALHRRIMLSSTYRQRSDDVPPYRQRDPGNRLLWAYPRRRLDLESMRDALLAVSGALDGAMGGRPVRLGDPPFSTRRTVYGFVDRQDLDGMYRAFDFASPDTSCAQRYVTTVPQQALFLMNSPFVIAQAGRVAEGLDGSSADPESCVRRLYRRILARDPDPREVVLGVAFVRRQSGAKADPAATALSPWAEYAQVLLLTNEFAFVD